MRDTARLSIELSSDLIDVLENAVASGEFRSTDEALSSALRAWHASRLLREWSDEEVGSLWDEGIESGPSIDGAEAFQQISQQFEIAGKRKA